MKLQQYIDSAIPFAIFHSLPIGVLVINSELKLAYINNAAQRFFLIDNAIDYYGQEVLFVSDRDYLKRVIVDIQSGSVVSNKRIMLTKSDRSVRSVELFAHSFSDVRDMYVFMFF